MRYTGNGIAGESGRENVRGWMCIVDGLHCTCTVIQVNVGGVIKCKGQNVLLLLFQLLFYNRWTYLWKVRFFSV